MAEANPIGDVGYTLISLLRDGMGGLKVSDQQIELVSPDKYDGDGVGLSLYLYHVAENPELENEIARASVSHPQPRSVLVLELYYLLTAHPPEGDTSKTADSLEQHRLLSEAIRIFREHGIISDPDLKESLAGGDRLQISINRQSPEQLIDIWNAFPETSHLPSVSYVVTPVTIDIESADTAERVVDSRMEISPGSSERTRGQTDDQN